MNKKGNFEPHEYEIYDSICHSLIQNCPIKGIVYLKCSPEICQQRIKIRNRKGEEEIGLDYLQSVHERHEEWINRQKGMKILVIDTGMYDIYNEHHQEMIKKDIFDFV
jgi:deoxyadenosine/deoxycytidine kinase